jgi:hypothetical protein
MKRTLRIVIVASLLLVSILLSAGWIHTYGGIDNDAGFWVEQTSDGGYIAAGRFMECDTGFYYLIKTDSLGDTLWTRTYMRTPPSMLEPPPEARCVQQISDGGYIIAGRSGHDLVVIKTDEHGDSSWGRNVCVVRPGGICVRETSDKGYLVSGGEYAFFLIKLDSAGDMVWWRSYVRLGEYMQLTNDGGCIITGYSNSSVWLMKTDSEGDSLWAHLYSLGEEGLATGYCVQQTSDGGYIITGEANRVQPPPVASDLFILKTDASGDSVWARLYGDEGRDIGYSICQTHDDGYIITGVKGLGPYTNKGVWLLKIDEQGDSAWARTFGSVGDVGACVQVASDRDYIICGSTYSYAPLHRGADVLLMKTDSLGEVGVEDQPVRESVIRLETSLNRLFYDVSGSVTGEAKLTLYSVDGRMVLEETIKGEGIWQVPKLPSGVYFVRVSIEGYSARTKVVVLR